MNSTRYNQIIDEAYENYKKEIIRQRELQKNEVERLRRQGKRIKVILIELLSKEDFICKIKTDSEFSQKWGLTIEERELSGEERLIYCLGNMDTFTIPTTNKELDDYEVPTKLITIKYQDETVITYE